MSSCILLVGTFAGFPKIRQTQIAQEDIDGYDRFFEKQIIRTSIMSDEVHQQISNSNKIYQKPQKRKNLVNRKNLQKILIKAFPPKSFLIGGSPIDRPLRFLSSKQIPIINKLSSIIYIINYQRVPMKNLQWNSSKLKVLLKSFS